jgi:CBS-domain-containing membrane protein
MTMWCFPRTMAVHGLSAVPVVDSSRRLFANLSATDLRGITQSQFDLLLKSVREFLDQMAPTHKSQKQGPSHAVSRGEPVSCTRHETLHTAMKKCIDRRVHRLWAVNDQQQPIGCVSLSDILATLTEAFLPLDK